MDFHYESLGVTFSVAKSHHLSSPLHVPLKLLEFTLLGLSQTLSAPSMTSSSWLLTLQVSSLQALPQGLVKIFTAPANHLYVVACEIQTPKLDPRPRTNPNHLKSKILHEGSRYFI